MLHSNLRTIGVWQVKTDVAEHSRIIVFASASVGWIFSRRNKTPKSDSLTLSFHISFILQALFIWRESVSRRSFNNLSFLQLKESAILRPYSELFSLIAWVTFVFRWITLRGRRLEGLDATDNGARHGDTPRLACILLLLCWVVSCFFLF